MFKDIVSCSGLKKSIFFYIFRKYNILTVYCKNFEPKYEIFTKLQHISQERAETERREPRRGSCNGLYLSIVVMLPLYLRISS